MMLKYIFKNTSGSFFRTLGRILCYFLIGIILFIFSNYLNILNVHADDRVIYENLSLADYAYFVNCASNNNCWNYIGATQNQYPGWVSPNIQTVANNSGAGLVIRTREGLVKDGYYTITIYLSNNLAYPTGNTTNSIKQVGVGTEANISYSNATKADLISNKTGINLYSNEEGELGSHTSAITYSFKAQASGNYIFMSFTTTSTVTSSNTFYGYVLTNHGMKAPTTDDIKAALNHDFNSVQASIGYIKDNINDNIDSAENHLNGNINASTNFIDGQITNSTNSINNNIDEMKEKQQETNDYLKDDTPPDSDISSLGNVQGLLPPGPVDSLLNIPFKFLSILTSSMGGVCKPMSGEFYGGTTLTLPCFNEVFWDKEELSSQLINYLSLIPASFILIKYFKHLYKKVDRAVSMETTSDDEWGVI